MLDYINTHIGEEYGNKGTAIAEIGILAQPYENLFIGAHVYNITRAKWQVQRRKSSNHIKIGAGYKFSEKTYLAIEAEK
jgi:hypothetical protein